MDGSEKDEKELHFKMEKYKVYGEWFHDNEETRKILEIKELTVNRTRRIENSNNFNGFVKDIIKSEFDHVQGVKNPRPTPLIDFCNSYNLSEDAVRKNISHCYITTTTGSELARLLRFVNCHPSKFDLVQPFIIPFHMVAKNGFSYNSWDKIKSDLIQHRDLKIEICMAFLVTNETMMAKDWT